MTGPEAGPLSRKHAARGTRFMKVAINDRTRTMPPWRLPRKELAGDPRMRTPTRGRRRRGRRDPDI